jgi:diguanylate cyclase (GGDEF)-like protein
MAFRKFQTRFHVPLTVWLRLAVLIFVLSGALGAQNVHSIGFWIILALLVGLNAAATFRTREQGQRLREAALELAVREKTADLHLERERDRARNHILEMLVSNEPLEKVLDAVLQAVHAESPEALCAILLKKGESCQVPAAIGVPGSWLTGLEVPFAIPSEIWRNPCVTRHSDLKRHQDLKRHPESKRQGWNAFISQLEGAGPGTVYSRPIERKEERMGAIVLFYRGDREPDTLAAEMGQRFAGLAIAHSRLYAGLHFQARHDSLTGLPNREAFEERLDQSLRDAGTSNQRVAVLVIDLDRFKAVNDTFSHRVGDLLLREIARRINITAGAGDTVARIGGDEFSVLVSDVKGAGKVSAFADRVLDAIRQPLVINGNQIDTSASIGMAVYPEDGTDAEKLRRAATAAMCCARDLGRDRAETFSARHEILDRARMDEALREALRDGSFVVHYQPKVGVDRRLAGFEALVRMNSREHGLVPPMSFIPVAESNGLIVPLGLWVLDEVCRQIALWEGRGLRPVSVAVNVSPIQICRADFAKSVEECMAQHGVRPASLELELTESLLINAAGTAQEQLRALRELGVKLSIDDFGTGYSSLSYLHRLPIDTVKLDRSFVQSIDTDQLAHQLVQAVIGVATGMGLSVVAEGVETEDQRNALLTAGCTLMQGYLFAKPKPAAELEGFLRSASTEAATTADLLQLAASVEDGSAQNGVDWSSETAPAPSAASATTGTASGRIPF